MGQFEPKRHSWFVCESQNRRLQKSLSDLNGTDPNIHAGTVEGVMRELCNAFVRPRALMPSVPKMLSGYRVLSRSADAIRRNAGAATLFEARVFQGSFLRCYRAIEAALTYPVKIPRQQIGGSILRRPATKDRPPQRQNSRGARGANYSFHSCYHRCQFFFCRFLPKNRMSSPKRT
jgi:hypothetical protein